MDLHLTFRHIEPTEGIKQYAEKKVEKLNKYLLKPSGIKLVFSTERFIHHVTLTLFENKHLFKSEGLTNDMYASIDQAIHNMEEQLKKYKEKIKDHKDFLKTDESKLMNAINLFDLRLIKGRQHKRAWKKKNQILRKKIA